MYIYNAFFLLLFNSVQILNLIKKKEKLFFYFFPNLTTSIWFHLPSDNNKEF